ncbi:magnesium-translocating P-type ATPase [Desulfovibrio sp. QI0442]
MVLRSFLPHGLVVPFARIFGRKGPAAAHSVSTELVRQAATRLLDAARVEPDEALQTFNSSPDGLTRHQVHEMRQQYGANILAAKGRDSLPKRLFTSFINPFSIVLLLLACISFFTDYLLADAGEKDLTAVIIVTVMVCISGVLHFVQEARSGNAVSRLESLVKTTIEVVREGEGKELPINSLVVGDVVRLAAGDMIPADMRILRAKDLFVSQSSLTGESEPVEKFPHALPADTAASPLDCDNLAFMGSNVVSGAAYGLVLAVGGASLFGSLARQIAATTTPTSFDKGVNSVSWLLLRFMICMAPVVLFINGFTKGDWVEAALFALSVAVGLTPEMLPTVVSANLVRGAVFMARKKVIARRLNAIQNLGAMDVLCTDKTGTLTQDRIVLEYSLDIHGTEDARVLRHAFLNSWFQTGLKNLLDAAIVNHADELSMQPLRKEYSLVDEMPFDFSRRRMSVVVADTTGKTQIITKGALEEMLTVCAYAEYHGQVEPLTPELQAEILERVRRYNNDGMRVVGVAHKTMSAPGGVFSVADEKDMVLLGYLAFLDPPKDSASKALAALNEHGVRVKVLTGDNDAVTRSVCRQVGLPGKNILLGAEIEGMDDAALKTAVEETDIFAKLSPRQKARIVTCLRGNGHVVGFMGDGINDAPAMKNADVGISVDSAVDVARESAGVILLEKDLTVLEAGVMEGRRTYANIIKYIKITVSSNFGNMFSVLAASVFLPFLPMTPLQILVLNLLYDVSCTAMPWDNVDEEFLRKPRNWNTDSIRRFMFWLGPTSSIFDLTTYALLFWVICPAVVPMPAGGWQAMSSADQASFAALFQAGWFVESLWTQTMVIHMLRTPGIPLLHSRAAWQVTLLTGLGVAVGTAIPFTVLGQGLDMGALPAIYFPWLAAVLVGYLALATLVKQAFMRRYNTWL